MHDIGGAAMVTNNSIQWRRRWSNRGARVVGGRATTRGDLREARLGLRRRSSANGGVRVVKESSQEGKWKSSAIISLIADYWIERRVLERWHSSGTRVALGRCR